MLVYVLVAVVVLVAALLAFGIAALLHLTGTAYILFVSLVLLLGIVAAVVILVMHFKAKKNAGQEGDGSGATGELDLLLNEANRKLKESQQGAKSLDMLPLIYVLGEAGSAKTTTVMMSGLNPELVAGAVPAEGQTVPTTVINLWFTSLTTVVEAGAAIRNSGAMLTRLVERTRAKAYQSAFGSGAAPRAAVVCVSAEQLTAGDAGAALMAGARTVGGQLREISRLLGMAVPVYVIVTKLDRVPHFAEYVRNLTEVEVRQMLGLATPRSEASVGVYVDEASKRLAAALDALCYKLGEFRVEMLDRENDARSAGPVYEFPREFGKLRKNLNQYLVELCKPSQLSANPYLRGFYFTGIRAQIVQRTANAPVQAAPQPAADAGATQFLNMSMLRGQQSQPAQQPVMVATRVPQWTFLARLFPEAILGDRSALTATNQTAPARLFRRILFGTLAFLFLLYTVMLIVSYSNNAAIEHRIQNAAKALPSTGANAVSIPSLSDLQQLEQLRQTIVQLDGYKQDGTPMMYRFGLYQGEKLDAQARKVYFDRFRPLILNPAQANFSTFMNGLPDSPANSSDSTAYVAAYEPLKAYLITTNHPEKSVPVFVDRLVKQYWTGNRMVDADQQALVQKQIDFYANELLKQPPYAIDPDMKMVEHARGYLSKFVAETSIYQAMLNDADKAGQAVDFNKMYPATLSLVSDGHVVRGAFTHDGFAAMQDALKNPSKYAAGEPWVLGDHGAQAVDAAKIGADLTPQYEADYIKEWHTFLTDARVAGCAGVKETSGKLTTLAGPASPLLALFYQVSHNTAVADPKIKSTFQPAQALVDPNNKDRFIGPGNTAYVNALLGISGALDQVATNPAAATDPNAWTPVTQAASQAGISAQQTAQAFNVDPQFHTEATVLALMQQPIKCAGGLAPSPGAPANGGGQKICGSINPLLGKYPFTTNASVPASIADVNNVFTPETGAVWQVFGASLKPYLVPQGAGYGPAPAAPQPVNPRFAQYFSHVARVSTDLYPGGAKSPTFTFNLRFLPSNGVTNASLIVDGQRIAPGAVGQMMHWDGTTAQKASLVYDTNEVLSFTGTWSLFQLVRTAQITKTPTGLRLDYPVNTATTVAGHAINGGSANTKTVSFELSGPGAEVLAPEFFQGLQCVAPVVK